MLKKTLKYFAIDRSDLLIMIGTTSMGVGLHRVYGLGVALIACGSLFFVLGVAANIAAPRGR